MKYIVIPVMLAAVIGLGAAPVFAESGTGRSGDRQEREHKVLEKLFRKSGPSIHIGQGGRAQLDAALVTAVGTDELTVKLFGHSYVVNTGSAEKKEGTPAVDSRVWVKGKMNESTGEIDAIAVRTFTPKEDSEDDGDDDDTATSTSKRGKNEDFQAELKALLEKLKKMRGN